MILVEYNAMQPTFQSSLFLQEKVQESATVLLGLVFQMHQAHSEWIRSVALTRIVYGSGHWRLAQALGNLAHSYLALPGEPFSLLPVS